MSAKFPQQFDLMGNIGEGEMFPPGHGIAYREWYRNRTVTALVPLNLFIGWGHDFYLWLRYRTPTLRDKELINAWFQGYRDGRAYTGYVVRNPYVR